ncbi:MAG TPA: hypothetical protein ENJ52_03735 [Aliiroseovarius sp.]|nr:hypothetical protein [Aliiroseovarius sp.]
MTQHRRCWQPFATGACTAAAVLAIAATPARAHVSERAIVLLLPTDLYRLAGVVAVLLTIALTMFLPDRVARRLTLAPAPAPLAAPVPGPAAWLGFVLFAGLVAMGLFGPHNPLGNLLPLTLFTGFWLLGLLVATLAGDWWRWFNPWVAPARLVRRLLQPAGPRPLPGWLGCWPATGSYLVFALYYLSDVAPVDPDHLARVTLAYWLTHLALTIRFGPGWLIRGEGFTLLFALAGRMRALDWPGKRRRPRLRLPGSGLMALPAPPASLGVFVVTLLAIGSFDGLNETFWWMARIGINPLEFPGRSAVVWQNRLGLLGAVLWLNAVFAACVWLGLRAAGLRDWRRAYSVLALSLLPIALAYHFAHYLPAALVSLQYWALAFNDPFETGARLVGLDWRVTTSFFNQHWTVRLIWLSQAGLITLGHMLSLVLAHGAATGLFDDHRKALVSQLPVAAFMVAFTWFGLWLLASPTAL